MSLLNTARDALAAQSYGLDVTGQNISNVNTPGYVRRSPILETQALGTATTGSVTQGLTNMDFGNVYTCAAFDNVGNLYAASTTTNLWRVWSPPGANTNTTTAVVTISIQPPS